MQHRKHTIRNSPIGRAQKEGTPAEHIHEKKHQGYNFKELAKKDVISKKTPMRASPRVNKAQPEKPAVGRGRVARGGFGPHGGRASTDPDPGVGTALTEAKGWENPST